MIHLGEKSFLPEFHGRLASGRKTATARTVAWGKPGDTFTHAGMRFRLDWVQRLRVGQVAYLHFWEEGFDSPEGFINIWKRIHKREGYTPDRKVWLHSFTRLYAYAIRQVHYCVRRKAHRAYVHSNIGASVLWCPQHGILATMSMKNEKWRERRGRRGNPGERQMTEAQYQKFSRRLRKRRRDR